MTSPQHAAADELEDGHHPAAAPSAPGSTRATVGSLPSSSRRSSLDFSGFDQASGQLAQWSGQAPPPTQHFSGGDHIPWIVTASGQVYHMTPGGHISEAARRRLVRVGSGSNQPWQLTPATLVHTQVVREPAMIALPRSQYAAPLVEQHTSMITQPSDDTGATPFQSLAPSSQQPTRQINTASGTNGRNLRRVDQAFQRPIVQPQRSHLSLTWGLHPQAAPTSWDPRPSRPLFTRHSSKLNRSVQRLQAARVLF